MATPEPGTSGHSDGRPAAAFAASDRSIGAARAIPKPDGDLDGLFARIPRVDAVRRRPRLWGVVGWGARQWVALVAASVLMFGLLGGFGAQVGWSGTWLAIVAAASLLGGFVLASAVPRPGAKLALSSCSALPLVGTLLVPAVLNPADLTTGVLGLGLLVVLASRQVTGAGC